MAYHSQRGNINLFTFNPGPYWACRFLSVHLYGTHSRVALVMDVCWSHLWSGDKRELKVPRHKLSTYGTLSFSIARPTAWNYLPVHLQDEKLSYRQFSRGLDTLAVQFHYVVLFREHKDNFLQTFTWHRLFCSMLVWTISLVLMFPGLRIEDR